MTTRLTVTLSDDEADALVRISTAELRDPRDQLRLILRAELVQRGLLILPHETVSFPPKESGEATPSMETDSE